MLTPCPLKGEHVLLLFSLPKKKQSASDLSRSGVSVTFFSAKKVTKKARHCKNSLILSTFFWRFGLLSRLFRFHVFVSRVRF